MLYASSEYRLVNFSATTLFLFKLNQQSKLGLSPISYAELCCVNTMIALIYGLHLKKVLYIGCSALGLDWTLASLSLLYSLFSRVSSAL